jgi:MFS transporter, DHA1 family, multidrug resistance protein
VSTIPSAPEAPYQRNTYAIAAAVGASNLADSFWNPFLPLFIIEVGAKDGADALLWIAVATSIQGVMRLIAGPIWGVLADRVGRKAMFLRALFLTGFCITMIAGISEFWHLAVIYGLLGIFSGYNPASVALTSVSVPESQIGRSLGVVTSAQYLGQTIGPVVGSVFLLFLDYRATIVLASLFPILAGVVMVFAVPNDRPRAQASSAEHAQKAAPLEPFVLTFQLGLVILLYFALFSLSQLLRLLSPVALDEIASSNVESTIGLTFTVGGLASAISLIALAPRFYRAGHYQRVLVVSSLLSAISMLVLAAATNVPLYIVGFAFFSLVHASMMPAANTLIAANVTRSRRGTAFGLAASASALAFMVGPLGAALFASQSISLGFIALAAILVALAVILSITLKEPIGEGSGFNEELIESAKALKMSVFALRADLCMTCMVRGALQLVTSLLGLRHD